LRRSRKVNRVVLIAVAALLAGHVRAAETCLDTGIQPTYPPLDAPPNAQASHFDAAAPLSGSDCFTGNSSGATWITVASTLRTALSQSELIERFGAISQLLDVQYWSTLEHAWRPLVSAAFAVDSSDLDKPRTDYSVAELSTGSDRYYRVTDTRSGNAVHYSLQLWPSSHRRVIVETTNIEPIKKWGITLYAPRGLSTLYLLHERSPGVWSYYSITRAIPQSFLAKGHEESYINRAVALFRHYMRLPATNAAAPVR
jgi:hypothetical protein